MSVAGSISKITVPNGDVYMIKDIAADNYLISNDVEIGYHDNSIWLSSKSYVTSVDCSDFGGGENPRYTLAEIQPRPAGDGLSCAVLDRTISTISISSALPVSVYLPPKDSLNGYARDFMIMLEISSSPPPQFAFISPGESIGFDADADDWSEMDSGLNIIRFIETK